MGDVGTGKSTIVEKITGEINRSSNENESVTRSTGIFWVPDGSLEVADTPGSNSLKTQFEHNVWIAVAINYRAVSRIFIVVKAEARIDCVIGNVRKYAQRYIDLPSSVVAILVTHMDEVKWSKDDFTPRLNEVLEIDTVAFSSKYTACDILVSDILNTCTKEHKLTVDAENFFELFEIHDNHLKILKSTKNEVKMFVAKKQAFDKASKMFAGENLKIFKYC